MAAIHERDTLNAFTTHTHAALEPAGRGPLSGLEFGAKDIYDIAGHRTGFGSPDWLDSHGPAARTAPAVQRVLDAGARMVGRTHTDEMAWSLFGENAHYGTPVNPKAPGRVPGGSSSGSAAAVAGGLVDFALGSDTGGSVRFPASVCGIFGMRPTHGRIPLEGACPLAPSFDTAGWFARDAATFERVGRVLLQDDAAAPGHGTLLVADDAFEWAGEESRAVLAQAADALMAQFPKVERIRVAVDDGGFAAYADAFRDLQAHEVWAVHGAWVTASRPAFGPGVRERFEYARTVSPERVAAAQSLRASVARRMSGLLADNAVLLLPTAPGIAPLRDQPLAQMNAFRAKCMGLLSIAGLARLPQASLPAVRSGGCPVGLSFVAASGHDTMLLALAARLVLPE